MKKLIELDVALEGLENLNAVSFYEANEHSKEAYIEIKNMLKALPFVVPVPMVRCGFCKYYDGVGFCALHQTEMDETDFCSYGIQKDGEQL